MYGGIVGSGSPMSDDSAKIDRNSIEWARATQAKKDRSPDFIKASLFITCGAEHS
jgi:hypothetical protein